MSCFFRPARAVFATASLFLLSACAALTPQTPSAIYDLTAPGEPAKSGGGRLQILIAAPATVSALDSNRIAARPSASEYAYLPGAVWSDSLPNLLQARLVQTIQNSGRVRGAGVPGQGLLIDYQLIMDIRAFEFTGRDAVAEIGVKLLDDANGRVVRSRVFRRVVPVASTANVAVVAGLDRAMDEVFVEITDWALARL